MTQRNSALADRGGLQSVLGVFADDAANTLWVCSNPPRSDDGVAANSGDLIAFDLTTGKLRKRYRFPGNGGRCNDIAVDHNGVTYATDTSNMNIVRLPNGGDALELWAGNGSVGPEGGVLDGIAIIKQRVLVNTLATSKLFAVEMGVDGAAGAVTEIQLDRAIDRPDGMRHSDNQSLLVVESGGKGRLSRINLHGDSGAVTTIKEGFPGGPTGVTQVGNTAYVVEAQFRAMRSPEEVQRLPFTAHAIPLAPAASGLIAGDSEVGKRLFAESCSLCHSTDAQAGTGPGLGGIVGEPAANSEFAFTDELRNAGLTWDAVTLDRYLTNPGKVVPGTAMAETTPVPTERRDIIAYLATLSKGSTNADDVSSQRIAETGPGDWNNAVPGRHYHITTADLVKPYATPTVRNSGPAAPRPQGTSLAVPEGFTVTPFAKLTPPPHDNGCPER